MLHEVRDGVEAGAVGLDITDVAPTDFLAEASDSAALVSIDKGLTFPVAVTPPDLTVPADRERLHQILANLLHNAVRHSPPGEPIRIEASRVGDVVRIDVVDRGPGIAREQRQQVFERFARGNMPAITGQISTGGTGLGLSIVRWAANLHGGTIEVADTASGCTMRLELPAARLAAGKAPAAMRPVGRPPACCIVVAIVSIASSLSVSRISVERQRTVVCRAPQGFEPRQWPAVAQLDVDQFGAA